MIYINGNNADSNGYNGDINYMVTTVEMEDYTTCNTWGIDGIWLGLNEIEATEMANMVGF